MKRIRLTVAYDGTNYCGWQLQPNGITIEEVLNKALSELLKEKIQVVGSQPHRFRRARYGEYCGVRHREPDPAGKNLLCPEPEAAGGCESSEIRGGSPDFSPQESQLCENV